MNRRIILFFVVAAVLVFPALAAAKAPTFHSFKIYRTPSGPDKGAITVITTLDYRGFAKAADFPAGALPPVSHAIVTLTGANSAITARDVVRLHPRTRAGAPVRFDFRIPASKARKLGDRKVKVAFAISLRGRTTTFATKSKRATRQFFPSPGGFCFFCGVNPSPPPPPTVAFGPTADYPTICLSFGSSGYAQPTLYQIGASDAADNRIYSGGDSTFAVATDGSFSDVGVEQPADIDSGGYDVTVTLSGTIPTAVLNGAPPADTGPAVMYDSGAPFGLFPNPIVAPYQSNNDWC
ncbi:MAG: hypothetical protein NTX95_11045 [Actinobacteria bacterium]|nr:hypothetical protein [Actinomycetota bacterium]